MSFATSPTGALLAVGLWALSFGFTGPGTLRSASDAQAVPVEVGPSVLHVDPTSFTLIWTTKLSRTSKVQWVGPGGVSQEVETPSSRHHRHDFSQLEPGTTYAYEVDGRFRGEVQTDDGDNQQRFAVFGHPGGSQSAGTFPFGTMNSALESADVDFALCTGDACYFTTEVSFKRDFFSPFQRFLRTRPIYLTAANHEAGFPLYEGRDFALFRQLFPYDFKGEVTPFYSFTRGNIEFFACASGPLANGESVKQLEWLRDRLATSRAEFRVLFLGDGQRMVGFNRAGLFKVARAGGVDAVFGGDAFGVRINRDDGVPYFFAGSGGVNPHNLFLVEQRGYELHIGLHKSTMQRSGPHTTLRSQRPKSTTVNLLPRLRTQAREATPTRSICGVGKLDLAAGRIDGIEFTATNPTDQPARIEFAWSPAGKGRNGFYQDVYRTLEPNETATLRYRIPRTTPRGGIPVALERVRITMVSTKALEGFDLLDHLSACRAFTDPLLRDG